MNPDEPFPGAAALAVQAAVLRGLPVPIESRTVRAGDSLIHFLEVGQGHPLVFLHGHGGGAAVWHPVFARLAAYRLLAVDLLGWGLSQRTVFTGRTPMEAQAWWVESLEAWRAAMGIERFTLIGHSLGGFVAASYALAYPDHLSHLVLVDAAGMTAPVRLRTSFYFRVLGPQRFVRVAGRGGQALVRWARRAEVARTTVPGALADYYFMLATRPGSAASGELAFARLLGPRCWRLPLLEAMPRVRTRTLLIWGEYDTLILPIIGYLLGSRMPDARLVVIEGAGHSPHAEQPDAFVETLIDFLEGGVERE